VSSFIRHGEDGLLGRTDDEIAAHLVRLLSDADLRHRIATHNRTLAPPCSWEDASVRLATVYDEAGQRLARA
jgi:hypothetical protein